MSAIDRYYDIVYYHKDDNRMPIYVRYCSLDEAKLAFRRIKPECLTEETKSVKLVVEIFYNYIRTYDEKILAEINK